MQKWALGRVVAWWTGAPTTHATQGSRKSWGRRGCTLYNPIHPNSRQCTAILSRDVPGCTSLKGDKYWQYWNQYFPANDNWTLILSGGLTWNTLLMHIMSLICCRKELNEKEMWVIKCMPGKNHANTLAEDTRTWIKFGLVVVQPPPPPIHILSLKPSF